MPRADFCTFELDTESVEFLGETAGALPSDLKSGNEVSAVVWTEHLMADREAKLPGALHKLRSALRQGLDVVQITGLPLYGEIPNTPTLYQSVETADVHPFDIPHIALASLAGPAYGYRHVRGGRIINDVFTRPGFEEKADSAFGSRKAFDFHADLAVHPDMTPSLFSLHCIKNPASVPTIVSKVSIDDLKPHHAEALQEPKFKLFYEGKIEGAHTITNTPIIEIRNGRPRLRYYGASKVEVSNDQDSARYNDALTAFGDALHSNALDVISAPGDIVFINNLTTLHGRPAFCGGELPQEERRWLRRLYTATSKHMIENIQQSTTRVLTPSST